MKIRKATGLAAFAGAMSVMMTIGTGTSGAVPVTSPDRAIDVPISGGCIAHIATVGQVFTSVIPLSGSPFTREVFLKDTGIVKFTGCDTKKLPVNYVLEVGYQIAPNADVSDGLSLGVSPQFATANQFICSTDGTAATTKREPCPADQQPRLINSTTRTTTIALPVSQKFKPGPIVETAVQKREWKKDDTKTPTKYPPGAAAIKVNNWHLVLNNAVGIIQMRSYVKLISSSSAGDDINVVYGQATVLR
ncbi:MspA family porin [Smaragdicoccus niigatensis]|uniref:MspA family porin n=1 Tax=Smaragdicoccus niigatensis TaxID=359359 RepID=UPI000381A637|nr:MspA family porin [Smaragdicoccus niigatensis]